MKVQYVGQYEMVEVPMQGGGYKVVAKNALLDTTNDHAQSLLDQPSNWQLPPTKSPKVEKDSE